MSHERANPDTPGGSDDDEQVVVTVHDVAGETHRITAEPGTNLRRLLLDHDLSPYTRVTGRANCGGRGLCATCGVRLLGEDLPPAHWHDALADRFGYPRLSCQLTVEDDLTVAIPEKIVWGRRE
jgi:ferredoxin